MKQSKFTFIGHEFKIEFDGSLEDALKLAIDANIRTIYLMQVNGKQYYFDDEDASRVVVEDMDWEEYHEKWWCDGLARNLEPIATIDVGSLCLMRKGEIEVIDMRELPVQHQEIKIEKIF